RDEAAAAARDKWCHRAAARAALIREYLWDEERDMFFDFDTLRNVRSDYVAATTLYPLWASVRNTCSVGLLDSGVAQKLVGAALPALEAPGGLLATALGSRDTADALRVVTEVDGRPQRVLTARQWEAPNGWAPHQMLAWQGLRQHGFDSDVQRLSYKWLSMLVENASAYHGTVPEKFDVIARSHRVFAEYGNVNTEFSYIAQEGFGWMNASLVVGIGFLRPEQIAALRGLSIP